MMNPIRHHCLWRRAAVSCAIGLLALPALAAELSWSGFGSLGYAVSDRPFRFQRFIDDGGTWQRDTLLAVQLDAQLAPAWSATVQAKLAPSIRHDSAWDPTLAWAFVGWRPDNDWLVRVGKLRVPLYLFSETQDVGTATDMVRLPSDLYWLAPTTDFTGLYGTRNWALGQRDLSLDFYTGYANTTFRQWVSNGVAPLLPPGALFNDMRVRSTGLVWTLRDAASTWRAGVHRTQTQFRDGSGFTVTFPRVQLAPGIGFWQVNDALPGPGVPKVGSIDNTIATAGLDWHLGSGWRLSAEVARTKQHDTELGVDATGAYGSLSRTVGRLTPYLTVSRLLSHERYRSWYDRLSNNPLPPVVPGAALVNAAQRASSELLTSFDQHSLALGLSVKLTPQTKLKAEWLSTQIGQRSTMTDAMPGSAPPNETRVNVLSLVYSFGF